MVPGHEILKSVPEPLVRPLHTFLTAIMPSPAHLCEVSSWRRSNAKTFNAVTIQLRAACHGLYIAKELQSCFGADSNLSPSGMPLVSSFQLLESLRLTCIPLLRRIGTISSCHLQLVLCLALAEVVVQRHLVPGYWFSERVRYSILVFPDRVHTTVQEEVMWTFSLDIVLCLHEALDVLVITDSAL